MAKRLLMVLFICIFVSAVGQAQSADTDTKTRSVSTSDAEILGKKSFTVQNNTVELYPNPVSDQLNISIRNSTFEKVEFELYNIIGNNLNILVEETGKNAYRINLKELNSGYYLLVIKDPIKRINKSIKFQKM